MASLEIGWVFSCSAEIECWRAAGMRGGLVSESVATVIVSG